MKQTLKLAELPDNLVISETSSFDLGYSIDECEICRTTTTKYGWFNMMGFAPSLPYNFIYETFDLNIKFPGAYNVQFVYPLGELAHQLAHEYILEHLVKGHFPKPGDKSNKLIQDFTIEFALVRASTPKQFVLRIIMPDQDNNTDIEKIAARYKPQWEGIIIKTDW